MINYPFAKKVNILGVSYTILVKKVKDDPLFKSPTINGYMNWTKKQIVIKGRETGETKDPDSTIKWAQKTLRHEITHAFLTECGLQHNARFNGSWADNEEMVDWFAIMGPRIMKAWQESGALE